MSETPSFLSVNLAEAKELTLAEDGEHKLRIMAAEMKVSKNGNPYLSGRMSFPNRPATEQMYFMLFGASEDADISQKERTDSDNLKFAKAFGYSSTTGIHPNELIGLEGSAIIKTEEYEGRYKNVVERYVSSPMGVGANPVMPPTADVLTPPVPATADDDLPF